MHDSLSHADIISICQGMLTHFTLPLLGSDVLHKWHTQGSKSIQLHCPNRLQVLPT